MAELKYGHLISTIFGRPFLERLRLSGPAELWRTLTLAGIPPRAGETVAHAYESSYDLLVRNYRCEYVYKNAIAAKILVARHSLRTSSMMTEVQIGKTQADVVVLNGSSTAYEIKTELDSLRRLSLQVETYRKAFEQVCVVGHESHGGALLEATPSTVGVLALTKRYSLRQLRAPQKSLNHIDLAVMFDMLRRSEYEAIVEDHFGVIPKVPNTLIYRKCRELFLAIPEQLAHAHFIRALRNRSVRPGACPEPKKLPHALQLHGVLGTFGQYDTASLSLTAFA